MGKYRYFVLLLVTLLASYSQQALATLLVWPIDPVLEDKQPATALWLENRDNKAIYVQIRTLKWQQVNGEDKYSEQKEIVASPPMAEIKPGQKQLIRLIKNVKLAANEERSFRILVDEVPRTEEKLDPDMAIGSFGLKFQMRYSIPLFVQGANIWTKQDYSSPRDLNTVTKPILSYRLVNQGNQQWLVIKNTGTVHARLSKVKIYQGKQIKWTADGLLGYVLAGNEVRFPVSGVSSVGVLEAVVNDSPSPININSY